MLLFYFSVLFVANNGLREFQEDYSVDTLMEFVDNSIKVLLHVSIQLLLSFDIIRNAQTVIYHVITCNYVHFLSF